MNVLMKTSETSTFLALGLTELKVMFCMVDNAKHNICDLRRFNSKITDSLGISDKTVSNAVSGLIKIGVLIKTKLSKVYMIDPSYFMVGDSKKIYRFLEMIKIDSLEILNTLEEYERMERENFQEDINQAIWDKKRAEQSDLDSQSKELNKIEKDTNEQ